MPSILIKNLPDNLHQALKQRAKRHHRSLNKEVIALLEAVVHNPVSAEIGTFEDRHQTRANRLRTLRGNYQSSLSSSETFAQSKSEEIERER